MMLSKRNRVFGQVFGLMFPPGCTELMARKWMWNCINFITTWLINTLFFYACLILKGFVVPLCIVFWHYYVCFHHIWWLVLQNFHRVVDLWSWTRYPCQVTSQEHPCNLLATTLVLYNSTELSGWNMGEVKKTWHPYMFSALYTTSVSVFRLEVGVA